MQHFTKSLDWHNISTPHAAQQPDLSDLLNRSVSDISQHQLPIQSRVQNTHLALTLQTKVHLSVQFSWKLEVMTWFSLSILSLLKHGYQKQKLQRKHEKYQLWTERLWADTMCKSSHGFGDWNVNNVKTCYCFGRRWGAACFNSNCLDTCSVSQCLHSVKTIASMLINTETWSKNNKPTNQNCTQHSFAHRIQITTLSNDDEEMAVESMCNKSCTVLRCYYSACSKY
jgi:hypothetical protein